MAGEHMWQGGVHGREACMAGGVHGRGGHAWKREGEGVCMAGGACMTGEMATTAGSMHPTGMHSCSTIILVTLGQGEKGM